MLSGHVFFRQNEVVQVTCPSLPFGAGGEVGLSVASATAALPFDFKEQEPFSVF